MASKIAVIRVRGNINVRKDIKDTLYMLRLYDKNYCVVVEDSHQNRGMIEKVKDFVTYGQIDDMILSYETGAKYIILFDYPKNPADNPYGILLDEHFDAMKNFWGYIKEHPRDYGMIKAQTAFVLPKDYGWGMRREDDLIWGLWPADSLSPIIWDKMNKLIERYGVQLDILYNEFDFDLSEYSRVYYWDSLLE